MERTSSEYILVVATRTEEEQLEAATVELGLPFTKRHGEAGDYYDLGKIGGDRGNRVVAIKVDMGPFGFRGSASSVIRHRVAFSAQGVICLGMAFGIDAATQDIGDVLVSQALLPYDNRDVVCDNGFVARVVARVRGEPAHRYDYSRVGVFPAREALFRLFERHHTIRPDGSRRVHVGSLLSGGSRVFCAGYRDRLVTEVRRDIVAATAKGEPRAMLPPIIGGEMEGVGLLSASRKRSPSWIVVKGISDFADGRGRASLPARRDLACRNSARFVLEALAAENAGSP
ncbi:MAG TPA: hypothetical protein VGM88_19085 [Kofleriaceae bacterium]|jgi:adenosylhomocysteine nucleosidase